MSSLVFKAADVADLVEYGEGNVWNLVRLCEEDEHLLLPLVVAGQKRQVTFITETGLYNILSQSRKPLAAVLHQIGDIRSLEERGIQIPIDLEDPALESDFSPGRQHLLR